MNKNIFLLYFFCLSILKAQEQASNWYFGENAGLNFELSTGAVIPLTNGALLTVEGCTTISNQDGDLLLYTDGSTVYNANHMVMQNGNGLLGDESSTQSAIVVPKPNDPDIYYIFTVGSNLNPTGLNYSEVDITLDGGLGGVTNKNVRLLWNCAEKVSAVLKDCESGIIWVISFSNTTGDNTLNMNTFHAFEVTNTGVNTTAITSNLNINGVNIQDTRGNLKFSPDGKKLACANSSDGLFIANFDAQTGLVSGALNLEIQNNISKDPYGVEFSPNSELLYVSASNNFFNPSNPSQNDNPTNHQSILIQYDLTAPNISNSQVLLDDRQLYRGGLQLGPNGKIYRTLSATYNQGSHFLGAINSPNTIGTGCNYQHNAINLGGKYSRQGLPPFIQSFFVEKIDIIQDGTDSLNLSLCEGDVYTLTTENISGAMYTWMQNGVILPENDSDLEIFESGNYEVLIEITNGECGFIEGQAFVTYSDPPPTTDSNLIQCNDDSVTDVFTVFNLTEARDDLTGGNPNFRVGFYNSQFNAENDINEIINPTAYNNISNPETLFVRITDNTTECFDFSLLTLNVSTTQINDYFAPEVCDQTDSSDGLNPFNLNDFSDEIRLLNGLENTIDITYYGSLNHAILEQNQLPTNYENTTPYSQIIYARAENNNACFGIATVTLTIKSIPKFNAPKPTYYCLNSYPDLITLESNIITEPNDSYTYLWSTGETTATIQVNEVKDYTVTVTNNTGCSNTNTIIVEPSNIVSINELIILDGHLENNSITVITSGEGTYHFELLSNEGVTIYPYQESNVFNSISPGIYTLAIQDIKNDCGIKQTNISVIGFPQFFTPNNDGIHDTWQVYGINKQFQPNSSINIMNRHGKLIKKINPLGKGWDGKYNGELLPSSDYWFHVTLQDGRVYKNHFSLKR